MKCTKFFYLIVQCVNTVYTVVRIVTKTTISRGLWVGLMEKWELKMKLRPYNDLAKIYVNSTNDQKIGKCFLI